jgi:hypothetical protein
MLRILLLFVFTAFCIKGKSQIASVKIDVFDPFLVSKQKFNGERTSYFSTARLGDNERLSKKLGYSAQGSYSIPTYKSIYLGLEGRFTRTTQWFLDESRYYENFRVQNTNNVLEFHQFSIAPSVSLHHKDFYLTVVGGPQINFQAFAAGTTTDLRFRASKDLKAIDLNPTFNWYLSIESGFKIKLYKNKKLTAGIQYVNNFNNQIVKKYYVVAYQHIAFSIGTEIDLSPTHQNKKL